MRKNAFTLIELLVVIVILAIIALIAVPIVIHIINDSKKSSEEQSVELYIDAVKKAISRKQLETSNFNPTECKIQEGGNLSCDEIEVKVDMKGTKPNKGIIKIKDNKVTYKNLKLNGKYYNKIANLIQDNNNNGNPDIGDKYTYKVNDIDTFNFYVLSFNEEDDTVNLIMDRNICEDGSTTETCSYGWHATHNNNYGPDNAMIKLYNATKKWNNVPDMIMDYLDENNRDSDTLGYVGIQTDVDTKITTITGKNGATNTNFGTNDEPLKARLPMYNEVNKVGCKVNIGNTCPDWLLENNAMYWLLSSQNNTEKALHILNSGRDIAAYCCAGSSKPIRSVITVPIDYLES